MIYFKAVTFDGKKTARKVLNALEDIATSYIWMEEGDLAKISVNQKGHISVHSTWAQDSSFVPGGIGFGALAGGVIGMLIGPGGVMAGAAIDEFTDELAALAEYEFAAFEAELDAAALEELKKAMKK